MLEAAGILATDFRADFMNPAFPAILSWYFMEPWTGIFGFSGAGPFPHAVGERVIYSLDPPNFLQDVRSPQRLPAVIVRFRELVIIVEVAAAVSALKAREIAHASKQPDAGFI